MNLQVSTSYGVRTWTAVLAVLLLHHAASSQTPAPAPTIVRLGTLGGSYATVYGVNAAGTVVGDSLVPGNATSHAFVFRNGQMTDLGTLGGTFSAAFAINPSGQIAGYSAISGDTESHPFRYTPGEMRSLGTFGGVRNAAIAINDAGWIAGNSETLDGANRAFLHDGTRLIDVGTLGGSASWCYGLNRLGWVVGKSLIPGDAAAHAFRWNDGTLHDLGTLGGASSSAFDINAAGWTVGFSTTAGEAETHAFLHDGTTLHDLGTLGGGYSTAVAINDNGQVCGESYAPDRTLRGFTYVDGQMIDLGTFGGPYTFVYDINQAGQIVGASYDPYWNSYAFLWENGRLIDLNTLLPPDSGWFLDSALYLSDGGHILGFGLIHGSYDWYLLSLNPASANQPPIAAAGPDQRVECAGATTLVVLDGTASFDPDGDPLSHDWFSPAGLIGTGPSLPLALSAGTFTFTLRVTDHAGEFAIDSVALTVADSTPPLLGCPEPLALDADAHCEALLPDLVPFCSVSDQCAPAVTVQLLQVPPAGSTLPLGLHRVEFHATDTAGHSAAGSTLITVADTTPPKILSLTANPSTLWPVNRKMVDVALTATLADNCDPAPACQILAVHSSDPDTGNGDKTSPDWEITGPMTLKLRAESTDFDRVYTVTVRCTDASGNSSDAGLTVTAPASHSGKPKASPARAASK